MPRRAPDPDLDLALAALAPADREAVQRWLDYLGLPPAGWLHVPPLRQLVVVLAVARVAAGLDLPHGDAVRAAAEALGLEDDCDLPSHPAERFLRLLRRWSADAWTADIDVHARRDRAA